MDIDGLIDTFEIYMEFILRIITFIDYVNTKI